MAHVHNQSIKLVLRIQALELFQNFGGECVFFGGLRVVRFGVGQKHVAHHLIFYLVKKCSKNLILRSVNN